MGVFQRAAEIISANLNDAVGHFERPDRMLRQALREMEFLIATTSTAVAKSIAAERLLNNACLEEARQTTLWKERAKIAFATGDEGRMRRALSRQMHHQHSQDALGKQLAAAQASNERLRCHLAHLKDKFVQAKGKLTAIEASYAATSARCEFGSTSTGVTNSNRAIGRFDYFYGKLEQGEAELAARIDLEEENLLEREFSEQECEAEIERALEDLRSQ